MSVQSFAGARLRGRAGVAVMVSAGIASVGAASPWATEVVSYDQGDNANPNFLDPEVTLGSPTRFTGVGSFPGAVTPFNAAFGTDELVSIGAEGHLTLRLGTTAVDDPANPFGIDLIVFSNAFFIDQSFPDGVAGDLFYTDGGRLELSADGVEWTPAEGIEPQGLFPTLGYADLTDAYASEPGDVLTDFQRPVDPSFDPFGKSFQEIVAAYDGSGGGTGVDIGAFGLSEVNYVRFSVPAGGNPIAIDAVSTVPAPASVGVLVLAGLIAARRRRH